MLENVGKNKMCRVLMENWRKYQEIRKETIFLIKYLDINIGFNVTLRVLICNHQ